MKIKSGQYQKKADKIGLIQSGKENTGGGI